MELKRHVYNYTDYTNVHIELNKLTNAEVSDWASKLKTIGLDIQLNTYTDFPGLSDIIKASIDSGVITLSGDGVSMCKKCGAGGDYPLYHAGPNKGKPNYNKKRYYPQGIKFNQGFISFKNSGDYCQMCSEEFDITNLAINTILENNLPVEIRIRGYSEKTKYIEDPEYKCFACGELMYESEMNRCQRIMDSSTYPAQCPKCGAVHVVFGTSHSNTGKFRMLTIEDYTEKSKLLKVVSAVENGKATRWFDISFKNGRIW